MVDPKIMDPSESSHDDELSQDDLEGISGGQDKDRARISSAGSILGLANTERSSGLHNTERSSGLHNTER